MLGLCGLNMLRGLTALLDRYRERSRGPHMGTRARKAAGKADAPAAARAGPHQTYFLMRLFTLVGSPVRTLTMVGSFLTGLRCSFLGGRAAALSARFSASLGFGLVLGAGWALSEGRTPAAAAVGTTLVPFVPGRRTTIGAD